MRTWLRKFVIYIPESDCKSTRNTIFMLLFSYKKGIRALYDSQAETSRQICFEVGKEWPLMQAMLLLVCLSRAKLMQLQFIKKQKQSFLRYNTRIFLNMKTAFPFTLRHQ